MLEYEKYQELQTKSQKMQEDYERQLQEADEQKEQSLEELTEHYETKLQEKSSQLDQVGVALINCRWLHNRFTLSIVLMKKKINKS